MGREADAFVVWSGNSESNVVVFRDGHLIGSESDIVRRVWSSEFRRRERSGREFDGGRSSVGILAKELSHGAAARDMTVASCVGRVARTTIVNGNGEVAEEMRGDYGS